MCCRNYLKGGVNFVVADFVALALCLSEGGLRSGKWQPDLARAGLNNPWVAGQDVGCCAQLTIQCCSGSGAQELGGC